MNILTNNLAIREDVNEKLFEYRVFLQILVVEDEHLGSSVNLYDFRIRGVKHMHSPSPLRINPNFPRSQLLLEIDLSYISGIEEVSITLLQAKIFHIDVSASLLLFLKDLHLGGTEVIAI